MSPPSIDDYADVLDERRRAVWVTVATAAQRCGGCLMGGTALALRLRHRTSADFDIFTVEDFSHPAVVAILRGSGHTYDPYLVRHNSVNVSLGGVMVQVLRDSPDPQAPASRVRRIAEPTDLCGMPVASIEDAVASKLNAVRRRSARRDLFDLYTVDTATPCRLEDGLELHRLRYGIDAQDQILAGLEALLGLPDAGTADMAIAPGQTAQAKEWLAARLPEVGAACASARAGSAAVASAKTKPVDPASHERRPSRTLLRRLWKLLAEHRSIR